eukprot:s1303_g18.t1
MLWWCQISGDASRKIMSLDGAAPVAEAMPAARQLLVEGFQLNLCNADLRLFSPEGFRHMDSAWLTRGGAIFFLAVMLMKFALMIFAMRLDKKRNPVLVKINRIREDYYEDEGNDPMEGSIFWPFVSAHLHLFAMAAPLTLSICSLGKEPFDVDILETDTVNELRKVILERLDLDPTQHSKLIFDTTVLEDPNKMLSAYKLETGHFLAMGVGVTQLGPGGSSLLLLLENPGPMILQATINDRTASDALLPAARSKELAHSVSSIEVSAKSYKDQDGDWGNAKSALFLTLKRAAADGDGDVLLRKNLYGTYRGQDYPYSEHPPAITFTETDEMVSLAEPGCFYQMEYRVGHGGGHKIKVEDWVVKISYVSSSCTEPSDVVYFKTGAQTTRLHRLPAYEDFKKQQSGKGLRNQLNNLTRKMGEMKEMDVTDKSWQWCLVRSSFRMAFKSSQIFLKAMMDRI